MGSDESRPKGRALRASWSEHVDGLGGAESAGARERNGGEAYLSGGLNWMASHRTVEVHLRMLFVLASGVEAHRSKANHRQGCLLVSLSRY